MGTGTTQPATGPKPRQSQWALVAREFFKRRLAVVALFIILGLVTISVFAPFLANDRPIYYFGTNRFEFREAARTVRGLIGQLANANKSTPASKTADQLRSVQLQFDLMSLELPADTFQSLREMREKIESAAGDAAQGPTRLRGLQGELRTLLDSLEPKLIARGRWPVAATLRASDLFFMTATLLVLMFPLWRIWAFPRASEARSRTILLPLLLMPVVSAIAWWFLVPVRFDRTDYKTGVLAADDTENKSGIVFQNVMWPPIAYALDEYDLAGKAAAPPWYPQLSRFFRFLQFWAKAEVSEPVSESGSETVNVEPAETRKVASRWNTPHWLGTDESGRDVLCRMIWGGRVSLSVGMVAVAIYVSIGIVVGAIAGYFRGVCDLVLSRIIEVVICFPSFFLILTIVAMVGPGLFNIMIVIGLTGWTGIARLVRGEFLRLVDQEFVLAGRALGYTPLRLIFRHVLPNAMAPVLVSATFGVAGAILTESALSFLGLGISKPTPSWGSLLADGREALDHAPWLIHFPGLAIFLTITAYNLIGEALRDAADPRLRGSR